MTTTSMPRESAAVVFGVAAIRLFRWE